jgi:hypothetical protein
MTDKVYLYIALIVSVFTYLFWGFLPKGSFYIGNALFIFMLCSFIFYKFKNYKVALILFAVSLNNLLDELFFDPKKIGLSELLIWFFVLIYIYNDRKRT